MNRKGSFVVATMTMLQFVIGCATTRPRRTDFSVASLRGAYELRSTTKPYVKFAGGPNVGSGRIIFDGKGQLVGTETWYGEPQTVRGTYVVEPSGQGSATVTTTDSNGSITPGIIDFQVESDRIQFVSRGLSVERSGEDTDWKSSTFCQSASSGCISGVLIPDK